MVQILEDEPSFGQLMARGGGRALGSALQGGLEGHMQKRAQEKENEALKRLTGRDFSGLSPELRKVMATQFIKGHKEDSGLKTRGIESIQHMRDILSRGKTGLNILNYATKQGRSDRAAMDTAALNLERLAVEMQGKGVLSKPRFEYMVKRLPSSLKTDEENAAILDEWENILDTSSGKSSESEASEKSRVSEKFIRMRDPSGALRKVSSKDVKAAKEAGYKAVK